MADPRVLVTAGGAAALATVFRAPLAGALLAAEHEGHLTREAQVPALVAAGAHNRTLLVPAVFLAETTGQAGLVVPGLLATIVAFLVVGD